MLILHVNTLGISRHPSDDLPKAVNRKSRRARRRGRAMKNRNMTLVFQKDNVSIFRKANDARPRCAAAQLRGGPPPRRFPCGSASPPNSRELRNLRVLIGSGTATVENHIHVLYLFSGSPPVFSLRLRHVNQLRAQLVFWRSSVSVVPAFFPAARIVWSQ
jgi:hypothetical protein